MATNRRSAVRSKLAAVLLAVSCGGTLFSACETRVKDAFVGGTRDYFLSLFDPQSASGLLFGTPGDNTP